jgi:hypothetical protein
MIAQSIATVKSGAYIKIADGIIQIVDIANHPIFIQHFLV